MNQRRAAEFFAGIGLMRMGLDHEGWTTVWANDLDEKKWEMHRVNFPDAECCFALEDVHHIKGKEIPGIELATALFRCSDRSLGGGRADPIHHGLNAP